MIINTPKKQRQYWIKQMIKTAHPVLKSLANRSLKQDMPMGKNPKSAVFAPLEAFGRLSCGIAPWLELDTLIGAEEDLRKQYLSLWHESLDSATCPNSKDKMVFSMLDGKKQALVDSAFLCHALVRAPGQIVYAMDSRVRENLIANLHTVREIEPWPNNWVLFSAMVETGIHLLENRGGYKEKIYKHVMQIWEWYLGDGIYGDGPVFRFDYYNSFVIQPMLIDIIMTFPEMFSSIIDKALLRFKRYAAILERMISPDGYFPIVGRSIGYRFGTFQALSQAALQGNLPDNVSPAQVRCALTAVIKRVKGIHDKKGWLVPGFCGEQEGLMEHYINTGSLYLCSTVFLALGLAPDTAFWSDSDRKWTSRQIYGGEGHIDEALKL